MTFAVHDVSVGFLDWIFRLGICSNSLIDVVEMTRSSAYITAPLEKGSGEVMHDYDEK